MFKVEHHSWDICREVSGGIKVFPEWSPLYNFLLPGHWWFSPWFLYSYLYSITSLIGVLMLLVLTPLGLARTFTVIGGLVMKPQVRHP